MMSNKEKQEKILEKLQQIFTAEEFADMLEQLEGCESIIEYCIQERSPALLEVELVMRGLALSQELHELKLDEILE